jgi:hypothetical protein
VKALSLWQPWASLWCSDAKEHETRGWELRHRGWLLVHAAKRPIDKEVDYALDIIAHNYLGDGWMTTLPLGAIVGAVNVVNCQPTETLLQEWGSPINSRYWIDYQCGNYAPGRFGFLRSEFKQFGTPIPYRGQQGLFDVPDDLVLGLVT